MNNFLGLVPLLAASVSLKIALVFIVAMLIVMATSVLFAWLLRHYVAASMRVLVISTLIAGSTGCGNLLAAAFAYDQTQQLDFLLPLLASNVLVFAHLYRILGMQFDSFYAMLRESTKLMTVATATLLIVAVIAQFVSADNALPLTFIVAAILIALHKQFEKTRTGNKKSVEELPAPDSTSRKRVRVTGPVR